MVAAGDSDRVPGEAGADDVRPAGSPPDGGDLGAIPHPLDIGEGYSSLPPGGARGPAVLIVPGRGGVDSTVRELCDRLAREGFVVLATEVGRAHLEFSRARAESPEDSELPSPEAEFRSVIDEIARTGQWLSMQPAATGIRIGVLGLGEGAGLALRTAAAMPQISAVVNLSGACQVDAAEAAALQAAVVGYFGELDPASPSTAVQELEEVLRGAGLRVHFETLPGVAGSFFDATRPDAYCATDWARVLGEVIAFLRAELIH